MGYKDLEIWKIANELVMNIHEMTINDLPKFEMFEEGSQIRRSVKSIKSNIVEGYAKKSTKEYLRFLDIAIGSATETEVHLDIAQELGYINESNFGTINDLLSEVKKLLYTYVKSLRAKS